MPPIVARGRAGSILVLLAATAAIHLRDEEVLDPAQAPSFAVHFARGAPGALPAGTRVRELTDANGVTWLCPTRAAVQDAGTGRKAALSRLDLALLALAGVVERQPCVLHVGGVDSYWSFEVCPGASARQFHAAVPGEDAPVAALSGEPGEGGGEGAAQLPRSLSLGTHVPGGDSLGVLPSGAPYLEQRFTGGAGGRSAVVQWLCRPGGMLPAASELDLPMELVGHEEEEAAAGGEGGSAYRFTVGVRDAGLCEHLESPSQLLAPLNGTCIEHSGGGWWQYSVCLGGRIRQYHLDNGVSSQESVLGDYDWATGETLVLPGGGGGEGGGAKGPTSAVESLLAIASSRAGAALVQWYTRGTPCTVLAGAPQRATAVRFECMPPAASNGDAHAFSFISIEETTTCGGFGRWAVEG